MAARDSYRGSQNHSHRSDNSGNYSGSSRGSGQRRFNDEPRESTLNELTSHLHAIDGRSYAAYKAIVGRYRSPLGWVLYIDRIQPDPYAPPTAIRVVLPLALTGADARLTGTDAHLTETDSHLTGANETLTGTNEHLTASPTRAVALRDYLARTLRELLKGQAISIAPAGQEILERSSVNLHETWQDDFSTPAFNAPGPYLELRLRWSLPAFGREIAGRQAARNLNLDLARAIASLDLRESELGAEAWKHCQVAEGGFFGRRRQLGSPLRGFAAAAGGRRPTDRAGDFSPNRAATSHRGGARHRHPSWCNRYCRRWLSRQIDSAKRHCPGYLPAYPR